MSKNSTYAVVAGDRGIPDGGPALVQGCSTTLRLLRIATEHGYEAICTLASLHGFDAELVELDLLKD